MGALQSLVLIWVCSLPCDGDPIKIEMLCVSKELSKSFYFVWRDVEFRLGDLKFSRFLPIFTRVCSYVVLCVSSYAISTLSCLESSLVGSLIEASSPELMLNHSYGMPVFGLAKCPLWHQIVFFLSCLAINDESLFIRQRQVPSKRNLMSFNLFLSSFFFRLRAVSHCFQLLHNRFVRVWPPWAAMATPLVVHRVQTWHLLASSSWLLIVEAAAGSDRGSCFLKPIMYLYLVTYVVASLIFVWIVRFLVESTQWKTENPS